VCCCAGNPDVNLVERILLVGWVKLEEWRLVMRCGSAVLRLGADGEGLSF
jgi:hypothetical protein